MRLSTSAAIAHQVEEHDGTHGSRLYERIQVALGWFSQVLDVQGGTEPHVDR